MAEYIKTNKYKIAASLIAIAICMFIARETYPALILAYIVIYSIGTTGLDLLFGFSGQISMGHAAFFAIGAYTSAILATKCGVNPFFGIFIGSFLATVAGLMLAIPASKLVKHFLSLMTIAFGQIVYMFVNACAPLTGGSPGMRNIPYISIIGYELNTYFKNFVFGLILLILVLIVKNNIIRSRTGRAFIAIKENTAASGDLHKPRNIQQHAIGVVYDNGAFWRYPVAHRTHRRRGGSDARQRGFPIPADIPGAHLRRVHTGRAVLLPGWHRRPLQNHR